MTLIENHIDIDYDVAMELLMKCRINSYCVMDHNDPNFYSRGRALYLAASSVDHTCEDTDEYAYMFDGRRFILRWVGEYHCRSSKIYYVRCIVAVLWKEIIANDRERKLKTDWKVIKR